MSLKHTERKTLRGGGKHPPPMRIRVKLSADDTSLFTIVHDSIAKTLPCFLVLLSKFLFHEV